MNPVNLARRIMAGGRVAEPAPPKPAPREAGRVFGGSVQVRHVDSGSCNGCEIEVAAAFGPVYDADRYGARLVASPRHADLVLVTGVVTHNMAEPLRRTVEATPEPRMVVAVGECARNCGVFRDGFGVRGSVSDVVEVDDEVPGCPPEPEAIVEALRRATGR
ncbi:MAG: NADH-quinone oxidoreductase subunit B family protein [Actinomycetales bacterium]